MQVDEHPEAAYTDEEPAQSPPAELISVPHECKNKMIRPTEGQVDDDVERSEFSVDVAVSVREVRSWLPPTGSVNACGTRSEGGRNIRRISRPKPNFDGRSRTLHSVISATSGVEGGSEAIRVWRLYATSRIPVVIRIAICRHGGPSRQR